jgi:adhesin/invasin
MRRLALCVMVLTIGAGCHDPDDYVIGPSQLDHVLGLTLSATTLPADGIARATITAQLDPKTDADKRNVTFSTTAGTLIAVGKEATSLVVQADPSGKAVVELRSTTVPATAQIEVTVASVTRTASVAFQALAREQVFDVSLSQNSIPADDLTTTLVTATLKRLGTLEQRSIKFETSLGTFIAAGQPNSRVMTVTADSTGRAFVELRSDGIVGTARVRVTALDTSYELEVPFNKLAAADVFDVNVSRSSIPADGFSTSLITVTLKKIGTVQQRAVKFETSAGVLIVPGQASLRAVTITADATGRAVAELQSDRTVGTARVRVTAFDVGYEFTVDFTSADPSQIITVSADPSSVPADGATPVVISARIASSVPAGRRSVTFRTTLGQILPTTIIEADGSNIARTNLFSATSGTARITATVDGVTAETTAQFTAAGPDRVIVAPDAVQLKSGGSTTIRVTLLRTTGTVSSRLDVAYTATTSGGATLGSFSRVTLAENGVSTATFNVDTTAYLGPVTIRASVGGVSGTATVDIIP